MKLRTVTTMTPDTYRQHYIEFKRQEALTRKRFECEPQLAIAILTEDDATPPINRYHFYHTAWAVRAVAALAPARHVDIGGSRFFAGIASSVCPMTYVHPTAPQIDLPEVTVVRADYTQLPFADASCASVSCMRVMDRHGLGRHGEAIDYDADLKILAELKRITAPGGQLLLAVSVGRRAVLQFNSHRIYRDEDVRALLGDAFELVSMAMVPSTEPAPLVENPTAAMLAEEDLGCGCYVWRRKA